mgnify:CR=1 FL=1
MANEFIYIGTFLNTELMHVESFKLPFFLWFMGSIRMQKGSAVFELQVNKQMHRGIQI